MVRIYQAGFYSTGQTIELSPEASQHVAAVLRMKSGESLILFSGNNLEYQATITTAQKKKVTVTIDKAFEHNRESPCSVHLLQGLSKGDRMEFVVQKAVELGVSHITPVITARCVVRLDEARLLKKQTQWQAIAIAACEQSGRNRVPQIHPPTTLTLSLSQCTAKTRFVLSPEAPQSWRIQPVPTGDIALLIGPEGGLTDAEINEAASTHHFQPMRLGPRVLRTETATLAALSVLQAFYGDLCL